jgi:hypothetical protein
MSEMVRGQRGELTTSTAPSPEEKNRGEARAIWQKATAGNVR